MENMAIKDKIKQLAQDYHQEVIQYRRHLHQYPELSYEEHNTAEFISDKLTEWGIEHQTGVAKTGVVGLIKGKNPGKNTIALRADMDALPIQEENEVAYKSRNDGVMHACGHDVHSSSLLGVTKILSQLKDEFEGTVKLIFQPSEEKIPGGASAMIDEGVLQKPAPSAIVGQHVMPHIEVGKVGFRSGKYMASADEIYMTVEGRGGHAAMPHRNIDPVVITSHIITALQQVVSRVAKPDMPTVLSFGKVIADGATNVIPDKVNVEGTFRTTDEQWRYRAHEKMKNMAEQMAVAMGGSCHFDIRKGYPTLVNDEYVTDNAKKWASDYLGKHNVVDLDMWFASEDFAYYSQVLPGCFYRLGTRNESRGIISPVHTSTFDIDERALEIGIGLMSWITVNQLAQKKGRQKKAH